MATYTVTADGHDMGRYTDFQSAGHSGVRCYVDGHSEERADGNAHGFALERAHELARYVFGKPAPHVKILRDDGTVAAEYARQ